MFQISDLNSASVVKKEIIELKFNYKIGLGALYYRYETSRQRPSGGSGGGVGGGGGLSGLCPKLATNAGSSGVNLGHHLASSQEITTNCGVVNNSQKNGNRRQRSKVTINSQSTGTNKVRF